MESLTYLKDIKISPKKMRMMLSEVKKKTPQMALELLMYYENKPAKIFYKAINSAINNATNTLKVSADMLEFKLFAIEEGRFLKRYKSGSRGGVNPIKKRYSHIKMIMVETQKGKSKIESKKIESKKVLELPPKKTEVKKVPIKKVAKEVKKTVVKKKI